jgi:uncharacterized protein with FMN-binding domain
MYPSPPDNRKQKLVTSFVLILAVVVVIVGVNAYHGKKSSARLASAIVPANTTSVTSPSTNTTQPTPTSTQATTATTAYKNGTYSAISDYFVPPGTEEIKVTLTLKNDVVTDSRIMNSESDGESAQYQESFASVYKSYVIGHKISDINLAYVAGASDTTDGFNNALLKIKAQAQA